MPNGIEGLGGFDPEMFRASLGIMAKGMVGVFLVILTIWLVVALLNRFTGRKGE